MRVCGSSADSGESMRGDVALNESVGLTESTDEPRASEAAVCEKATGELAADDGTDRE